MIFVHLQVVRLETQLRIAEKSLNEERRRRIQIETEAVGMKEELQRKHAGEMKAAETRHAEDIWVRVGVLSWVRIGTGHSNAFV